MCLCDNIGLVALILLGWELRASYITELCVQAVMILSPLPPLYSHSNLKNFYITPHYNFISLFVIFVNVSVCTDFVIRESLGAHTSPRKVSVP